MITKLLSTTLSVHLLQVTVGSGPRSTINDILSTWGVPLVVMLIVVSAASGVLYNIDLIIDKEGRGTRREGVINTLWVIAAVAMAILVISAILLMTGNIRLSV